MNEDPELALERDLEEIDALEAHALGREFEVCRQAMTEIRERLVLTVHRPNAAALVSLAGAMGHHASTRPLRGSWVALEIRPNRGTRGRVKGR